MLEINSNQNNCLETQNLDYLSKIQKLQKRISDIIQQLKKPLNYILPADFQSKYQQSRQCTYLDNEWIQKYKQIIAYMIQGQINLTLMGLTMKFIQQFGGQISFWMDLICDFSQNQKYQENYRMWQINDRYKECLPLPIVQIDKIRKFRKLAKNDISISKNLLSLLYELKLVRQNPNSSKKRPQDLIIKIKQVSVKHQQSDRKFISFLKVYHQVLQNVDFFHPSINLFNKSIDNFKLSVKNQYDNQNSKSKRSNKNIINQNINNNNDIKGLKQKMITDFSQRNVFKNKQNENLLLKKLRGDQKIKQLNNTQKVNFDRIIHSLSQPSQSIHQLRQKFFQQVQSTNIKAPQLKQLHPYYSSILIPSQSYFYLNFPILQSYCKLFSFINPFQKNQQHINYQISQDSFYQQFLGDDIQHSSSQGQQQQNYDDQSLDEEEKKDFCDLQDILDGFCQSEDEKQIHMKAIDYNNRKIDGNYWVYDKNKPNLLEIRSLNYQSEKCQYSTISSEYILPFLNIQCPCYSLPMKIQLQQENIDDLSEYQINKLKQLIHDKSRKQIFQKFQSEEEIYQRISKEKLLNFINKKTKKVRKNIGKNKQIVVYHIVNQSQNNLEKQQKVNNNKNFTQQDTVFELENHNSSIKNQIIMQKNNNQETKVSKLKPKRQKKQQKQKIQKLEIQSKRMKNKKIPQKSHSFNSIPQKLQIQTSQQQSKSMPNTMTLRTRNQTNRVNYNFKQLEKKAYGKLKSGDLQDQS